MNTENKRVVLGRVSGLFGVKGWVKVFSDTEPRDGILNYNAWQLHLHGEWRNFALEAGQQQGKAVVAKLAGIDDRDAAAGLLNADIAVRRDQLPRAAEDEFYWADLEGLSVRTATGVELGTVSHLLATGANDVLVVKGERERLIPFVRGQVVQDIDLDAAVVIVDWDPEF